MSKPLTQEEIDILLEVRSHLSTNDQPDFAQFESIVASSTDHRRVNSYNFKRPRLFSQDQIRVLNHVHEAFARDLSVYLSAQLRTIVDINLMAIDQVLYSEFVLSSAPPSALFVVEDESVPQKMVFEIDPRFVIFTIEKLFGGPGYFLRRAREISQIERRIMNKVMARAFRELEKAWEQVFKFRLQATEFETNAEFVQIMAGVEPALVATFDVSIYEQRSFINICYPYRLLELVLGRTGMKQWISSAAAAVPQHVREKYENTISGVNVELRAELGTTALSVTELMELQVGDVIPLQRRVSDPIQVYVGRTAKYKAVAGVSGRARSLRIIEKLNTHLPFEEDEPSNDR